MLVLVHSSVHGYLETTVVKTGLSARRGNSPKPIDVEILPWAIACGAVFSIPTGVAIYMAGDPNESYGKVRAMTAAASTLGAFCLGMLATMFERYTLGGIGPEMGLIQAGVAASIAIPLSLMTLAGMEHWDRVRSKNAGLRFTPKFRRQRK